MFSITRRAALLGGTVSLCFLMGGARALLSRISYGCDRYDAGPKDADFFVSINGDDSWEGSLEYPVRTINRGIYLLSKLPYGSLAIRGGTYREHVKIENLVAAKGTRYKIHRFGSEKVIISAREALSHWNEVPDRFGKSLGLPHLKIFEATIPAHDLEHNDEFGLNLFIGEERVHLAYRGGPASENHTARQMEAFEVSSIRTNSDGILQSITSKSLVGWRPNKKFKTRLLVHAFPNIVKTVSDFSTFSLSGTLKIASGGEKITPSTTKSKNQKVGFLLENDPTALTLGRHIVSRQKSDEVRVYFSPKPSQMNLKNISYAARSRCVSIQGCRNVTLFGLDIHGASAGNTSTTRGGYCLHVQEGNQGVEVDNCHIGGNYSSGGWGTAAYFYKCKDIVITNCTIRDAHNSFGIFVGYSSEVKVSQILFDSVSMSPLRVFGAKNMEFSFSKLLDSAHDIHANKFNYYLGCDNVLNYGITSENTGGYATYSSSSRINFAFCRLDVATKSYDRAIVSQNVPPGSGRGSVDGTGEPVVGSSYYYWNNTLYARPGETLKRNSSLYIGPKGAQTKHIVVNNILFGLSEVGGNVLRSNNIYKALNWTQSGSMGWRLMDKEEVALGLRLHNLKKGEDFSPIIEKHLKRQFPNFKKWNLDVDGLEFDWRISPPVGCSSVADASQPWEEQ